MLDTAIKYADKLRLDFNSIWFRDKYKYYNYESYYDVFNVSESTWQRHEFVSVNRYGGVIGYIGYNINRIANYAHSLSIINFTNDHKILFGRDVASVINDIFEKFAFNKLAFCVVVGNPIEKTYDKMVVKYGGRIVGVRKQDTRLIDGQICDVKDYEILRDDYMRAVKKGRD